MSACHESLIWSGLSGFWLPELWDEILCSVFPVLCPKLSHVVWKCMCRTTINPPKTYLEFKVCSFHREVRPSSPLSTLLFFAFPSSLPVPLHTVFGELHFWAAERIPWRVAMSTIPRIHDTLFPRLLLVTPGWFSPSLWSFGPQNVLRCLNFKAVDDLQHAEKKTYCDLNILAAWR